MDALCDILAKVRIVAILGRIRVKKNMEFKKKIKTMIILKKSFMTYTKMSYTICYPQYAMYIKSWAIGCMFCFVCIYLQF